MRFYPKLNLYKSGKNNVFDGTKATSYGWHVYAIVLDKHNVVITEKGYSNTTKRHIRQFEKLIEDDCKRYYVKAPEGLNNISIAISAIKAEIEKLQGELRNKRNRDLESRKARIAVLRSQLKTIKRLQRFNDKALAS